MQSSFFITPAAWEHPEFNPFHAFLYSAVEEIQNHSETLDEAEANEARAAMIDNLLRIVAHEMGILIGLAAQPPVAALEIFVEAVTRATGMAEDLKDALPSELQ